MAVNPTDILTNLSSLSGINLELEIYTNLRGSHNRELRKQIATYLGLPPQPIDVVTLARAIKEYFRADL